MRVSVNIPMKIGWVLQILNIESPTTTDLKFLVLLNKVDEANFIFIMRKYLRGENPHTFFLYIHLVSLLLNFLFCNV